MGIQPTKDNPLGLNWLNMTELRKRHIKEVMPAFPAFFYKCPHCGSKLFIAQAVMDEGILNAFCECPFCEKYWYATGKGDQLFISPKQVHDAHLLWEYTHGKVKQPSRMPQVMRSPCE
jgi:hypothetical protein